MTVFAVIWMVSPWLYFSGLRVEAVRVERAGNGAPGRRADAAAPDLIRVRFTTPQDVAAFRARWRLPFIQAGIAACNDRSAGSSDEVVTQGAGYFAEDGRVRALGQVGGRYTYEAMFDDRLDRIGGDHRLRQTPALSVPGGLCLRLHGATLASGSVRSASVPLVLTSR